MDLDNFKTNDADFKVVDLDYNIVEIEENKFLELFDYCKKLETKLRKANRKFDELINGNGENMGMLDMQDHYYRGCSDDDITEIESLLAI